MKNFKFKNITALVLVLIFVLSFASCKTKSEDGETTQVESISSVETASEIFSEAASETPQTTAEVQTTSQNNAVEEPGVESLTDGNKTVVYPKAVKAGNRTFPVIVWANGTGCPTQSYMALLETLANGGYIVVADSDVMTANGTTQRNSVDYILGKSMDSSSVFYNRVNTQAVGACGHSQGGRSSINAAQDDTRIKCVVSIAGASSADEARNLTTPTLFLTGTSDFIVVSSQWCKPSYDAVTGRAAYASLIGGVHTTCMTNPEKVSGYTLNWFDAYLKNDSSAKAVFNDGGELAGDSAWQDFQQKN